MVFAADDDAASTEMSAAKVGGCAWVDFGAYTAWCLPIEGAHKSPESEFDFMHMRAWRIGFCRLQFTDSFSWVDHNSGDADKCDLETCEVTSRVFVDNHATFSVEYLSGTADMNSACFVFVGIRAYPHCEMIRKILVQSIVVVKCFEDSVAV